jgi:hypothetical protein
MDRIGQGALAGRLTRVGNYLTGWYNTVMVERNNGEVRKSSGWRVKKRLICVCHVAWTEGKKGWGSKSVDITSRKRGIGRIDVREMSREWSIGNCAKAQTAE